MPAQRKTVTILFSDVVGSTSLGEDLDPEVLRRVMTTYFDHMRAILEHHGGTVEKYIGDAIVAVFGVPELHEDDAVRAVRAAAEMRSALASLNAEIHDRFGVRIEVRTGINTGEILADDRTAEVPLTADAANVAARLEQTAGTSEILLGGSTYRLVKDAVAAEPVGPVELKGKAEPVPAWRLTEVAPEAPGVARRLASPIVGRDRELAALARTFEEAVREDSCRLVTAVAPPGVGKSRLAAEFVRSVEGRARVFRCRCLAYGEGITFFPVAEIIRQAADITERDSPAGASAKIEALVARVEEGPAIAGYLRSVLGLTDAPAPAQETFWSVRRLLETMAGAQPVVTVVDDIHWAEPTLLDLLEYLAGWSTGAPLFVLCLARPELLEARPGWGTATPNAEVVRLQPLTDEQSEELIENLLGQAELDETVAARIRHAAEGNPLFVEEILRTLVEDGTVQRKDGRWAPVGDTSAIDIPPTIHALLAARLQRLPAEERAVIERASIVGKVFWWGAVAHLSPAEEGPAVGARLQALVRRELVHPDRSTFVGEDAFRFGHILIRDAAYRGTTKELRAELHERFADWLEAKAGERVAEFDDIIGYHLEQSHRFARELAMDEARCRGLAGRAAAALGSAGRRALGRNDINAAASLMSRTAALLDPGDPERLALLPDLGEVLAEAGRLGEAREVFQEAIDSARVRGDERVAALAAVVRSSVLEEALPDREQEARRAIEVLERQGDRRGLAKAWRITGFASWSAGRIAEAEEAVERAVAHARATGERREEGEAHLLLSATLVQGPRPVDEAVARAEEILRQNPGDRTIEAYMAHALAHLRAWAGRFDEARALGDRYVSIVRDNGQRLAYTDTFEVVADVEFAAGRPAEAASIMEEARRLLEEELGGGSSSDVYPFLAGYLYDVGRHEEAEAAARIAIASASHLWSSLGKSVMAKIHARRGESDAEALAEEAVAAFATTDMVMFRARTLVDLADVRILLGSDDEAVALLQDALALYERKGAAAFADRLRSRLAAGIPPPGAP